MSGNREILRKYEQFLEEAIDQVNEGTRLVNEGTRAKAYWQRRIAEIKAELQEKYDAL